MLTTLFAALVTPVLAQNSETSDTSQEPARLELTLESAVVSKYMWRGLRLTNDWSWQPAATAQLGGFSVNFWGNLDLTAANEGDVLFLPQNPQAGNGDFHGMRGHFSEVDLILSYTREIGKANLAGGAAAYLFPGRSASIRATTELFGTISFPEIRLAPSATLYLDADESWASGPGAAYLELGATHSIPLRHPRWPELEIAGKLGIANRGFSEYYQEDRSAGFHDVNVTISAPIALGDHVSAKAFLCYTALLGGFRALQYPDPRDVYLGNSTAGGADTVWGGISFSFDF